MSELKTVQLILTPHGRIPGFSGPKPVDAKRNETWLDLLNSTRVGLVVARTDKTLIVCNSSYNPKNPKSRHGKCCKLAEKIGKSLESGFQKRNNKYKIRICKLGNPQGVSIELEPTPGSSCSSNWTKDWLKSHNMNQNGDDNFNREYDNDEGTTIEEDEKLLYTHHGIYIDHEALVRAKERFQDIGDVVLMRIVAEYRKLRDDKDAWKKFIKYAPADIVMMLIEVFKDRN